MTADEEPEDGLGELPMMVFIKKSSQEIKHEALLRRLERGICARIVEGLLSEKCKAGKDTDEIRGLLLEASRRIKAGGKDKSSPMETKNLHEFDPD